MFDDVIAKYGSLEPAGVDHWNPLTMEQEVWHRMRLFICLSQALRRLTVPIAEAKILDVGCGVGRSTRALLEFGARPENVLGLDLRPSALALAQALNPAIGLSVAETFDQWPRAASFDLCMQCTVFSSIKGAERRRQLAEKMETMVPVGRWIFWWDLLVANDFAGSDPLEAAPLFNRCAVIWEQRVPMQPLLAEASRRRLMPLARTVQRWLGRPATHAAVLLQRTQ